MDRALEAKPQVRQTTAMMQCRLGLPHSQGLRAGFSLIRAIAQGSQIYSYEIIHIKFLQEGKV